MLRKTVNHLINTIDWFFELEKDLNCVKDCSGCPKRKRGDERPFCVIEGYNSTIVFCIPSNLSEFMLKEPYVR